MRRIVIASIIVLIGILAGCSDNNQAGIEVENIKQLVEDYSLRTLAADNVSITSKQLIVTEKDSKKVYNLPEDEFFVSFAPYVNHTHPCAYHNFTSCQGELVNESFDVKIVDEDGNVVINETMKSGQNGFIDLWLPREQTFEITVTQGDKSVQAKISTFEDDPTCITTLQLS